MSFAYAQIIPLDRYNWELCLNVRVWPEQEQFCPSVMYSLAQARFENLCPYGIQHEEEMVGFLMYGEFAGICWISRIMIDRDHQSKGIAQSAIRQLISMIKTKKDCKEIRTSFSPDNGAAKYLFESLGFVPLEDQLEDEMVMRYEGI